MRQLATRGLRAAAATLLSVVCGSTFAASQPAKDAAPATAAPATAAPATAAPATAAPATAAPAAESAAAEEPAPTRTASASTAPLCAAGRSRTPEKGETINKGAAPPPPPTPQQLAAFDVLKKEAERYTTGAKDFRRTL